MDVETAANSFIQLYEFLPTEDTSLDEPVVVTFPATDHDAEWTIVLNRDPTQSDDVEGVLTSDSD